MGTGHIKIILREMEKHYPEAHCELNFSNGEELLIATILSAQCTDKRVNQVTAQLFPKYPDLFLIAKAQLEDLETLIRSTGFFHNKAKNILAMARKLVKEKNGKVPPDFEYLIELPGVGRKTAHVVMGNAFGIASGIVVDTHVRRVSHRLGLVTSENPEVIERELVKLIPKSKWIIVSHWFITHGRNVCRARNPSCGSCFLKKICPQNRK
ncbi:MAG: endonuclease III [Bdellovibrionales bacterium]|nr:endonuclease III [Bdellovibrionales bacterium]